MRARFAIAAVAALSATAAAPAVAQKFPERPVTMIVPFGPGGTTDIMARLLQEEFGRQLGVPVVIQNTAGAGGSIGIANASRAKPDGYTIAMTTTGPQSLQPARRDTGYTPESFDYLCGTYDVPVMTMVAPDSPFKTLKDLVEFGRKNPGKITYASSGTGGVLHLSMLRLFKQMGVDALHVPYKSTGEMIVPLKSGTITAFNETPPIATQYQLRALVALGDKPVLGFESVPTAKELKVDVRASVWGGLVAPKGLPADARNRLETACKAATDTTMYKARAQAANNPLVYRTGAEFRAFANAEHELFKKLVKENNLEEK